MSKTATAPIEFVRMQMMVGQGGGLANIVATAWAKGPQAFFAGNLADVVRVTPSKAVQLAAFDSFKRVLSKRDKVRFVTLLAHMDGPRSCDSGCHLSGTAPAARIKPQCSHSHFTTDARETQLEPSSLRLG
jgi:hypothetical protein